MFEQSEIGTHPTYLLFFALLAIAPVLLYFSSKVDRSESKFAKSLKIPLGISSVFFSTVWVLLVANTALVFSRVVIGMNLLILSWLPLEAQIKWLPIGLVNEILSLKT